MREVLFEYGFKGPNGVVKKVFNLSEIPNIQDECLVWNTLPLLYVREFTGLTDFNGTRVYEGDIVHLPPCCSDPNCPSEDFFEVKIGLHNSDTQKGVYFWNGHTECSWWHNRDIWYVYGNKYEGRGVGKVI